MTFPWEGGNGHDAPTLHTSRAAEGHSGRWASEGAISRHLLSATGILKPEGRPGRRWRCAARACVELRRDGPASSGWFAAHCFSFRIPNSALHICMTRFSHRRGPWTRPSRLASPCLRIQKICIDAPARPVLASRSTSTSHARRPWLGRLDGHTLPGVRRCRSGLASNFR